MRAASLLREARLRAGLTQKELASRAGVKPSAVSRWERGEVEPSFRRVEELIRSAGFDLVVGLAPHDEHDTVLVRRMLRLTPAERLDDMVKAVRALDAMARAARG